MKNYMIYFIGKKCFINKNGRVIFHTSCSSLVAGNIRVVVIWSNTFINGQNYDKNILFLFCFENILSSILFTFIY